MKIFAELPEGEIVISMTTYKDNLFVATNKKVYSINEAGELTPVMFNMGYVNPSVANGEYSLEGIVIEYHNNLAAEFGPSGYWDEKLIAALKLAGTEVIIEDERMKVVKS